MMGPNCAKTKILKPFDHVEVKAAPFGDVEELDFRLVRDSSGNCQYIEVESGKRNISDYVESFKTGCSLKSILDRCKLMPVRDKVAYLNQTEQGVSADLTSMPKDGTEAQIMLQRFKSLCPDFAARLRNGESFDKLALELLSKDAKIDSPAADKKDESEVTA